MDIRQATEEWVRGFNAISCSLIERAFKDNIDDLCELTTVKVGDYVHYNGQTVKVLEVDYNERLVTLYINETKTIDFADIEEVIYDGEILEVIDYMESNVTGNIYFELENHIAVNVNDIDTIIINDEEVSVFNSYDTEFEIINLTAKVDIDDVNVEHESWLPIWKTLWTFGCSLDKNWARKNPEKVSACGFRIYEDKETGDIYLGLDRYGYDFYEEHWIPLYKAMGYQWHNQEKEKIN